MRVRNDGRAIIAVVVASAALVGCTSRSTSTSNATTPSRPVTPSSSGGVATGSSVLNALAPADGSFLVHGSYPSAPTRCKHAKPPRLLARYPGKLTIVRSGDGTLGVTVTLPFESYLDGLAEVPSSWPVAALEAQAIAARSYALAETGWHGPAGGTLANPICATTSCQVYGGIPVPLEDDDAPVVRGRAPDGRPGAHVRGPAGGHRVLLHLERPHVRQRSGLRQRSPAVPAPGARTRRPRLAGVALDRAAAVRRPDHLPPRGRRVAGGPEDHPSPGPRRHGRPVRRRRHALGRPGHPPGRRERVVAVPVARAATRRPAGTACSWPRRSRRRG